MLTHFSLFTFLLKRERERGNTFQKLQIISSLSSTVITSSHHSFTTNCLFSLERVCSRHQRHVHMAAREKRSTIMMMIGSAAVTDATWFDNPNNKRFFSFVNKTHLKRWCVDFAWYSPCFYINILQKGNRRKIWDVCEIDSFLESVKSDTLYYYYMRFFDTKTLDSNNLLLYIFA